MSAADRGKRVKNGRFRIVVTGKHEVETAFRGVKFGIMLAEIHGSADDTQAAIAFLQQNHVKVEVLGYV